MRIDLYFPRDLSEDRCRRTCDRTHRIAGKAFGGAFGNLPVVNGMRSFRASVDRTAIICVVTENPRPPLTYDERQYVQDQVRFYAALYRTLARATGSHNVQLRSPCGTPLSWFDSHRAVHFKAA